MIEFFFPFTILNIQSVEIATTFVGTHADVEGMSAWGKIRKMEVPVSSCIILLILHLEHFAFAPAPAQSIF